MPDIGALERDRDTITYSGFTGVRNDVDPERYGPGDLEVGENVVIDATGRISRREGYTRQNATATHSVWADGDDAFCVQGSTLYRVNADLSLTSIKTGLTGNQRMSFAKVNGEVYFSNGHDSGVIVGGTLRPWGIDPPGVVPVTIGVGRMPAGVYQYTTTWVRPNGWESGAGPATVVTVPANGKLTFSFLNQAVAPGAYYRNIYLTPPNGDVLYFAGQVYASAITASYAADTKELALELRMQHMQAAPAGQLVGFYAGRMFVAVGENLYPSEPFAYEHFDLRRYIPMDGRITMFAPLEDKETINAPGQNSGLFLGTSKSTGILVGNDPSTFQYVPKVDYGPIEGALAFVDGTLFGDGSSGARMLPMWLSQKGICVGLPGMEVRNITRARFATEAAGQGAAVFDPLTKRFITVSNF